MRVRRFRSGDRGQTATIGIILVFAIMLAGASVVVIFGASALDDSQQSLSVQRAEKALTQLDSKAALVALGNTDVQTVSFARTSGDSFRVVNGTGWMNVSVKNTTDPSKDYHLVNQSLGSVKFENGDDVIAYQGGGVWKSSGERSVMVSPPEFHFRNGTLTLPILNVTGDPSLGSGAAVSETETIKKFPDRTFSDRHNPMDQHRVFVVVRSDHYRAWGDYFGERTDGEVEYDHDKNKVTLELVSPIGKKKITAATASLAASGTFSFQGDAESDCSSDGDPLGIGHEGNRDTVTNSYDSSTGNTYCNQAAAGNTGVEGDVIYGGDVDIGNGGNHNFHGDIVSGSEIDVPDSGSGKPFVWGHINYTDSGPDSEADMASRITDPSGEVNQISGVQTAAPINFFIESTVDDVESDNDNGDPGVPISSNRLDFGAASPSSEVTLTDGTYLLNRIEPSSGDKVRLQTTDKIVLAVRGDIHLRDSTQIEVVGDGTVEVYVEGLPAHSNGNGWDVSMNKGSEIFNADDNGTRFRLYGKDSFDARIGETGGGASNLAKYQGVIYAPPGVGGTGVVRILKGEVFGGILTGTTEIPTNGKATIHYDESLQNTQVISRSAKIVKVTYLHVTVNRIHVQSN